MRVHRAFWYTSGSKAPKRRSVCSGDSGRQQTGEDRRCRGNLCSEIAPTRTLVSLRCDERLNNRGQVLEHHDDDAAHQSPDDPVTVDRIFFLLLAVFAPVALDVAEHFFSATA